MMAGRKRVVYWRGFTMLKENKKRLQSDDEVPSWQLTPVKAKPQMVVGSKPSQENDTTPFWRTIKSNGRPERVGTYGIDLGERGVYDSRNKLNELTGKEWLYFTNSVWITAYPPSAGKKSAFDLRKIHPCPKPPELMRDLIRFFTKRDQWALDPFAGVGGSLLGASLCEPIRNAVGIEIDETYAEVYYQACDYMDLKQHKMIIDDARNMLSHPEVANTDFDLIVTDPPYSDMMNRKKNGQKKKLYGKDDPTPFTSDPRDLGNLNYEGFLKELRTIIELAVSRLKPKKYCIVFCSDFQPKKDNPNLIHTDIINELRKITTLQYRGMRIWHDQTTDLYPFGYPYAFVANQMHQYILIFRKDP